MRHLRSGSDAGTSLETSGSCEAPAVESPVDCCGPVAASPECSAVDMVKQSWENVGSCKSDDSEFEKINGSIADVSPRSASPKEESRDVQQECQVEGALGRQRSQGVNVIESKTNGAQGSSSALNTSDDFISTAVDDIDRSPSPFVVLERAESGDYLTFQGTVDLRTIPLEEERAQLLLQLRKLREKERNRRRVLLSASVEKGGQAVGGSPLVAGTEGQAPMGCGDVSCASLAAAAATPSGSERADADAQCPHQLPHRCEKSDASASSSAVSECSTEGVKVEATAADRTGEEAASSVFYGVDGAESDEEEPEFTRQLKVLNHAEEELRGAAGLEPDSLSDNCSASVESESTAHTGPRGGGVVPGCAGKAAAVNSSNCNRSGMGSSNGYYIELPMDETGQVEYVFNEDDAAKRIEFRTKEHEVRKALGRVEGQIGAIGAARANKDRHYWQSDESTDSCPRCGKLFSLTVRRHHCRRCGVLLCNDCCSQVGRDMYVQVRADALTNSDGVLAHGSFASSSTEGDVAESARLFDRRDLTNYSLNQPSGKSNCVCLPNNGRQDRRGRGGLKVRVVPWIRICNVCYIVCLRARLEGNYKPILEDNRRRFHVLKEEEQSLLCINNSWETRWAQLDVLKHAIVERTVHVAHDQMQHVARVFSDWLHEWRLSIKP